MSDMGLGGGGMEGARLEENETADRIQVNEKGDPMKDLQMDIGDRPMILSLSSGPRLRREKAPSRSSTSSSAGAATCGGANGRMWGWDRYRMPSSWTGRIEGDGKRNETFGMKEVMAGNDGKRHLKGE